MDTRAPAVVAVVVTTGAGPGLEAALASLTSQDYSELSVLVVANGDALNVAARVAAVAPHAFVSELSENRGFGAACNEASLMVEGSAFFLFCHDDVRLDPDAVTLMVEAAYRLNAGVVSPKVVAYEDPDLLLHVGQTSDRYGAVRERVEPGEIDHGQQDLERDVFVAPGGVTLVRADLFRTLRGFDPVITVIGEDLDLCWRAQVAGARVVVAPQARVAHRETIATGERYPTATGTRRKSLQDLQRRHQLLVVASGWSAGDAWWVLLALFFLDTMETAVAVLGRDLDRAGAIVGSWRWLWRQRRTLISRRRQLRALRVLSDEQLRRLQVGGASRLRQFATTLVRHGFDRARGILPREPEVEEPDWAEADGVGFAAAFSEDTDFDELPEEPVGRFHPSRLLASFRTQAAVVLVFLVAWFVGARNLVALQLPLVGRLAPLDSWWTMWRDFFSSWSPVGVGSGAPGSPGYAVLAVAGTFVFGRMGVLPKLALIFAVPYGAWGVWRLLRGRVSNRARIVAALAYAAAPAGLNAIGEGRVDVLILVGALPFVVRRIFELMDVAGFREAPYPDPVPFGRRGWRRTEAGQRMGLYMVVALVSALAPATLVVVALVIAGVALARWLEPDANVDGVVAWRLFGSIVVNVAIFLLPLTVDVFIAGREALGVFGLSRGPWSVPSFFGLLRDVDGPFGAGAWGWLLPVAALFAFVLCRGERRDVAGKVATIAVLTLAVETLVARHWLGSFAPDLDVLLVLYGLCLAVLIGLGISALEHDLTGIGFGWRQPLAVVSLLVVVASAIPLLGSFGSGRFDLPTTSVTATLNTLAPTNSGGYRVLWLGDPSVLPAPGWSVTPGLELTTSMNGLPGGPALFAPPGAATSGVLLDAVRSAMTGQTVQLGSLLSAAGVSTIVVDQAQGVEIPGVQTVPRRPVPDALLTALARQTDLELELATPSVVVYANTDFHGIISATTTPTSTPTPVFSAQQFSGELSPGTAVRVGLAPSGAFSIDEGRTALARNASTDWTTSFEVSANSASPEATLVLHRFPLNGILAGLTLLIWLFVWLGFGWVARLEWFFTGRRPRHRRRSE